MVKSAESAAKAEAKKKASEAGRLREIAQLKKGIKHMLPTGDKTKRAERAEVKRMSLTPAKAPKKTLEIPEGKGTRLGDIPYVTEQLSKRTAADQALQALHRMAFNAPSRAVFLKKHLREFSGVVYDGEGFTAEKLKARVEARPINVLRDVCSVVGLERGGTREELVERVVEWLEKPVDTGADEGSAKREPRAKKAASSRKRSRSESPEKPAKKAKKGAAKKGKGKGKGKEVKKPLSAYMFFVKDKREEIAAKHPDEKVTEIAKRLGAAWRKLKEKDRTPYEDKAKKDKARYAKECK